MSEAIIHPSVHRGPPATRVRWRLEVALAGVVEQQPQFAVHKLCVGLEKKPRTLFCSGVFI